MAVNKFPIDNFQISIGNISCLTFQILGSAMYTIIQIQMSLLITGFILLIQFMINMLHLEHTGLSIYQNQNG